MLGSIFGGLAGKYSKKLFGNGGGAGMFGTGRFRITQDAKYQDPIKRLLPALERRASGKAPSFAEMAGRKTLLQNLANTQTGIRSYGGLSGALKQKMIQDAAAKAGSGIAEQSGLLRAKEQEASERALASTALGAQEAEIGREKIKSGAFAGAADRRQKGIKALGEGIAGGFGKDGAFTK